MSVVDESSDPSFGGSFDGDQSLESLSTSCLDEERGFVNHFGMSLGEFEYLLCALGLNERVENGFEILLGCRVGEHEFSEKRTVGCSKSLE